MQIYECVVFLILFETQSNIQGFFFANNESYRTNYFHPLSQSPVVLRCIDGSSRCGQLLLLGKHWRNRFVALCYGAESADQLAVLLGVWQWEPAGA